MNIINNIYKIHICGDQSVETHLLDILTVVQHICTTGVDLGQSGASLLSTAVQLLPWSKFSLWSVQWRHLQLFTDRPCYMPYQPLYCKPPQPGSSTINHQCKHLCLVPPLQMNINMVTMPTCDALLHHYWGYGVTHSYLICTLGMCSCEWYACNRMQVNDQLGYNLLSRHPLEVWRHQIHLHKESMKYNWSCLQCCGISHSIGKN